MLHRLIEEHFEEVRRAVKALSSCDVEVFREVAVSKEKSLLTVRLRFHSGHFLEVNEAVLVEAQSLTFRDYRYHFQDTRARLIFRYDRSPRFPDVAGFPHHKHIGDDSFPSARPALVDVISEAVRMTVDASSGQGSGRSQG